MDKGSAPKSFFIGVNVFLQVLLLAVLLVVLNLAINRWHPPRVNLTSNNYYALSEKSKQLLKSLREPVDVIVFFQPSSESSLVQRVFQDIQRLLDEYKAASVKLRIEYVDPDRDRITAEKLAKEYNVKVLNVVVFAQGKRSKYVQVQDLVDVEQQRSPFGESGPERIKAFKGEQVFTSAIQNVTEDKQSKIYFLEGHGEGNPDEFDRKAGFSTLGENIRRDNLVLEKLNFFEKQQVPADCDLLVICGPSTPLSDVELNGIHDYLSKNGRLMVLLDAMRDQAGLEKLLEDYGVKVGNDIVLFKVRDLLGGAALVTSAPGSNYGIHPITESFRKTDTNVLLPACRSVDQMTGTNASKYRVTVLVETPPSAWGETNLETLRKEQKAELDDKDRKGPVPLAVAVEPPSAGEMEREGMRMVVYGSSSFVRNGNIGAAGNLDFFMSSLHWLLKQKQLMGITPKAPKEFSLVLDIYQERALFLTDIIAIPLGVAIIGLLVWMKRRK